jgi:hypothetical protein
MATALFAEVLENFQHFAWLIPKSQIYTSKVDLIQSPLLVHEP